MQFCGRARNSRVSRFPFRKISRRYLRACNAKCPTDTSLSHHPQHKSALYTRDCQVSVRRMPPLMEFFPNSRRSRVTVRRAGPPDSDGELRRLLDAAGPARIGQSCSRRCHRGRQCAAPAGRRIFSPLCRFIRNANLRHYRFLSEGIPDIAAALAKRNMGFVLRRFPEHSLLRFCDESEGRAGDRATRTPCASPKILAPQRGKEAERTDVDDRRRRDRSFQAAGEGAVCSAYYPSALAGAVGTISRHPQKSLARIWPGKNQRPD